MKYFIHVLVLCVLSFSFSVGLTHAQLNMLPPVDKTPTNLGTDKTPTNLGTDRTPTTPSAKPSSVALKNPIKVDSIAGLFQALIEIVLVFAVPIVVFFIILAGFKYVTARGSESAISEAHMALLYALIGGVLILGAFVLIEVISGTVDAIKN